MNRYFGKTSQSLKLSAEKPASVYRLFHALLFSWMALTWSAGVTAKDMSQASIISACTTTINQYAHYRDQLNAEKWGNLFTQEGVFVFPGMTLVGREAIAKRIADNDGKTLSRHLTGSIAVSIDSRKKISAVSYVYVYQAAAPSVPGPVPASKYIVAEYHDELRMTDDGCKFAKREAKIIFMSDDA